MHLDYRAIASAASIAPAGNLYEDRQVATLETRPMRSERKVVNREGLLLYDVALSYANPVRENRVS